MCVNICIQNRALYLKIHKIRTIIIVNYRIGLRFDPQNVGFFVSKGKRKITLNYSWFLRQLLLKFVLKFLNMYIFLFIYLKYERI